MAKEVKYYIYVIINKIDNMKYIGDHTTYNIEKDHYMGSGKLLKIEQKKIGIHNFVKIILQYYEVKKEARYAQRKFIKEYNTLYPNGYNLTKTGGAGGNNGANKGRKASDLERANISLRLLGNKHMLGHKHTDDALLKISNASKSRVGPKSGMYGKTSKNKGRTNWFKHTEEACLKISNALKGKPFTEEHKQNISKGTSGEGNSMYGKYGSNNPNFGSKRSEETKQKMKGKIQTEQKRLKISEANKKRPKQTCPYCNKEYDQFNYKRWHNENCKYKITKI